MSSATARRPYRKRRRAEQEQATRERIVDATLELHATVGPARTTISAIAERAGVQRLTVYRHFPDERELLAACGAAFTAADPPPDPAPWAAIADPAQRAHTALTALYGWYRRNEEMLANVARDAPGMPELAAVADPTPYLDAARRTLLRGRARRRATRAAAGHALAFSTWCSLARGEGLSDADAAAMMARLLD
jgi:AcrR family transcriptional regulator